MKNSCETERLDEEKKILSKKSVKSAIKMWKLGNERGNENLIERAGEELAIHKNTFPLAMYFGALIKLQISNDNIEENLKELITGLSFLLDDDLNVVGRKLIKSFKEVLLHLSEEDSVFKVTPLEIKEPSFEKVKKIMRHMKTWGVSRALLSQLYCHLDHLSR